MTEQITTGLSQPESDVLEALNERVERAQAAFAFARAKIAGLDDLHRIAPGAWVVTRQIQENAGS